MILLKLNYKFSSTELNFIQTRILSLRNEDNDVSVFSRLTNLSNYSNIRNNNINISNFPRYQLLNNGDEIINVNRRLVDPLRNPLNTDFINNLSLKQLDESLDNRLNSHELELNTQLQNNFQVTTNLLESVSDYMNNLGGNINELRNDNIDVLEGIDGINNNLIENNNILGRTFGFMNSLITWNTFGILFITAAILSSSYFFYNRTNTSLENDIAILREITTLRTAFNEETAILRNEVIALREEANIRDIAREELISKVGKIGIASIAGIILYLKYKK